MIICCCWQLQSLYFEYVSMCVACLVPETSHLLYLTDGHEIHWWQGCTKCVDYFYGLKICVCYYYCTVVKQILQQIMH
jgi:hypothetical protein